jgi:prolyl-tRNA synthetase
VSRAMAVIAEQAHDERGLSWPWEVAPFQVHVVATGKDGQTERALELGAEFDALGVRVVVDDRVGVSAGVKFTDAELLGMPVTVVVGKGLASGVVEIRNRATGERSEVPIDTVVAAVVGR